MTDQILTALLVIAALFVGMVLGRWVFKKEGDR